MCEPNIMCDSQLDPRLERKVQYMLWGQLKKCKHGQHINNTTELMFICTGVGTVLAIL